MRAGFHDAENWIRIPAWGVIQQVQSVGWQKHHESQVFNLFGRDNLGGIGANWQTNAWSPAFGRQQGAQARQQAELATRITW